VTLGSSGSCRRHLRAGRVRLVFVARTIPSELLAIIEFLNDGMTDVEIFGVEVRRYAKGGRGDLCATPNGCICSNWAPKGFVCTSGGQAERS
jgi:hypothetical protein